MVMAPVRRVVDPVYWLAWVAAGLLAGCSGKPAPKPGATTPAPAAGATTAAEDDMLASAVFQLQPENLGIDADLTSVVSVLRNWREQSRLFASDSNGFMEATLKSIPTKWLTEEQRRQITSREFTAPDALFIRNSLLTATMSRHSAGDQQSELDRVMAMFEYAMRTVTMQPPALPQLPFPLYEILLIGQGTSDDRAWVFAALLKQQRIDTVILQAKEDPEARLVGVVLDDEVYLFDTRLGLPIPRGDDPPAARIARPATWNEMKEHPEWWQPLTLRADQPYPWTAEQLETADVLVYSPSESWSTRMRLLESVLPANSICVLYDPLGEQPGEGVAIEPLAKRIARGNPAWTADKLQFWDHPLSIAARMTKLGPQAQQLGIMFERFKVPVEIKFDEKHKKAIIKPTYQHLKCRTEQLQGKFKDATTHYLSIRHLLVENLPQELMGDPQVTQQLKQLYIWAASDASFWTAVCKFEQGDYETAIGSFQDYEKRFARIGGDWMSASRYLRVLAHARLGKLSEARTVIAGMAPDDPQRPGLEILMKRWPAAEEEKKSDSEEKPETKDKSDAEKKPESESTEKSDS